MRIIKLAFLLSIITLIAALERDGSWATNRTGNSNSTDNSSSGNNTDVPDNSTDGDSGDNSSSSSSDISGPSSSQLTLIQLGENCQEHFGGAVDPCR